MIRRVLPLALLLAALPVRGEDGGKDAPAPSAAPAAEAVLPSTASAAARRHLAELFADKDRNERFWIVRALGDRLSSRGEASSLALLLEAAGDKDPSVRGGALRAMTAFTELPKPEFRRDWFALLDAAASKGLKDPSPGARGGARDLRRALDLWKDPGSRTTPAPPEDDSGLRWRLLRARRSLRWVWSFFLPFPLVLWAMLGLPVLDLEREEGRRAVSAWRVLRRHRLAVVLSFGAWICLVLLLASHGFTLLARFVGSPLHGAPWLGWRDACLAAFLMFSPGYFAASGLSRKPSGSLAFEWVRAFLPAAALTGAVFFVLLPLELVYRVFLRRVRPLPPAPAGGGTRGGPGAEALKWMMENGALPSAYAAACVMGREGSGLLPALRRVWELRSRAGASSPGPALGLGVFDGRFGLLCVAPVFVLMCGLSASGLPMHWLRPWPFVVFGCALWSWIVIVAALFSALQVLEGALAAGAHFRASGERLPEPLEGMADAFQEGPADPEPAEPAQEEDS